MPYVDTKNNTFPTFHQRELNDYMKGWNSCLKSVLQQPTADVVEVTRCKDCDDCEMLDDDSYYCSYFNKNVDSDGYCSYGG